MRKNARVLRNMCRVWHYDSGNYRNFFNILHLLFVIKPESEKELGEQFGLEPSKVGDWRFGPHLQAEEAQRDIVTIAENTAEKVLDSAVELNDITATMRTSASHSTSSTRLYDVKIRKI